MKIIVLLSVLICILCAACDNKNNFNEELLAGRWKLQQSDYPVFSPTVNFSTNGEYEMVELIKYPFSTTLINLGTVTGKYVTYDNKIEFVTATVVIETDITGSSPTSVTGGNSVNYYNNWNSDSVLLYTNSGKPPVLSGYNPVIWTVIELTESTLKAIRSPSDTLVYIKD